ncbi:MAG: glycosyl transferase family 1, partial [Phenylobacterium sp.]
HAVIAELGEIRAAAPATAPRQTGNPVKGDPFRDFAAFASQTLSLDTRLSVPPSIGPQDVLNTAGVELDAAFGPWRADPAECVRILQLVAAGEARTVREALLAFPTPRRRAVELGLAWMAKLGFLDWLA